MERTEELTMLLNKAIPLLESFLGSKGGEGKQKSGDKLLNTKETADYLGVKTQTLALWRMRGDGPGYHKIGRTCKYSSGDLDRFIKQQRINN